MCGQNAMVHAKSGVRNTQGLTAPRRPVFDHSVRFDIERARPVSAKTMTYVSSLLILPILYVFFSTIHISAHGYAIEQWLPRWDRLLILVTVIGLERLYTYRYAVSQRSVLTRDVIANIVKLYVTRAVQAMGLL